MTEKEKVLLGILDRIDKIKKEHQTFSEFKNMINNWYYGEYKEGDDEN